MPHGTTRPTLELRYSRAPITPPCHKHSNSQTTHSRTPDFQSVWWRPGAARWGTGPAARHMVVVCVWMSGGRCCNQQIKEGTGRTNSVVSCSTLKQTVCFPVRPSDRRAESQCIPVRRRERIRIIKTFQIYFLVSRSNGKTLTFCTSIVRSNGKTQGLL